MSNTPNRSTWTHRFKPSWKTLLSLKQISTKYNKTFTKSNHNEILARSQIFNQKHKVVHFQIDLWAPLASPNKLVLHIKEGLEHHILKWMCLRRQLMIGTTWARNLDVKAWLQSRFRKGGSKLKVKGQQIPRSSWMKINRILRVLIFLRAMFTVWISQKMSPISTKEIWFCWRLRFKWIILCKGLRHIASTHDSKL